MTEPNHANPSPNDDEEQQTPRRAQHSEVLRAVMYGGALSAGVFLVLFGKATAVEASGYVSPFLVVFEGTNRGV
ncbi:hypothetical protein ABZ725_12625 [Streptomyces sp. NPDC006872]|uniref:hypothetical protein n=1 Tax=Streptomyces sp. NPDC006872 TaxID=3155720 RepID=UPI0033D3E9F7